MDFQNKHFQRFIRMKDSDVKKILDRHPMSAKYFYRYEDVLEKCGQSRNNILLENGDRFNRDEYNLRQCQLTFDKYLDLKNTYKKNFFREIGTEATLDFIKRRAKFYYGEDRVWLDSENKQVIIHFPEILITNSVEDSHVMKDIFIRITVWGKFKDIELARTTINKDEYRRYIFSHMSESTVGSYGSALCFGNTDLYSWILNAKSSNSFVNIDKIIASLEGYLSWESLEGKPYKYMSIIRKIRLYGSPWRKSYRDHISSEKRDIDTAMSIISESGLKLRYKISGDGDEMKITITNTYDIDDLLKDERIEQFYRYENYSYKTINRQAAPLAEDISSYVTFKGVKVPVKIEPSQIEFNPEKACHINLFDTVVTRLENELLEYLIKKENE